MNPKAKLFKFSGYKIDAKNNKIVFKYSIEFYNQKPINFSDTIVLPKVSSNLNKKEIHKFLEPLCLILGISYYKLYCPSKISVSFKLSKEEAEFWNIVYKKGLGEFLYRNNLDPNKLAKFPYVKKNIKPLGVSTNGKILLGVGGGKDSIVALGLLKNFEISLFLIETGRRDLISERIIKKSRKSSFTINRILDPKIFKEHQGSYNGHVPISAVFAFLGILSAFLYEHKYVVVGNEYSSNFGNLNYKGEIINHQWSKSAEFEFLFQEYTKKFITPDIIYFSLLRQFHEIRIAKMFAKHKEYFHLFSSCNKNFRVFKDRPKSLWCGKCPKCAFVFLMLSSFLDKKEVLKIFGKNLFDDATLLPLFKGLLGFGETKPFDCVGTFEESRVAFYLASKKFTKDTIIQNLISRVYVSKEIIEKVFKTFSASTLPAQFKLLGVDKVCILGYGKEGKVTEKYIKKKYPNLKIKILDQTFNKNYLNQQADCDFAIKTPGIPKNKIKIPYTTATNIFFAENKNFTIGVTGSKGKSTTATLVYEILKEAGKKVRLLGNVGNPMLEALIGSPQKDEIFIIELSSYMLEDIEYSPNIAVMLNLFPEHMDYHNGIENYYQAKNNIFKFQKSSDRAFRAPFNIKLPVQKLEIPLLGAHNIENIKAAVKVAKFFEISNQIIRKAIIDFNGLPHRLEYIGEFQGVKFYDDAISTTPESTIAAIKALPQTNTIFLGGEDRGYDFSELEKVIRKSNIKNIILFPDTGKRILKSKKDFKILETESMKEAVNFAFKNTSEGTICLLSTASPSYSLWKNFEEKGNLFKKFVIKYRKQ